MAPSASTLTSAELLARLVGGESAEWQQQIDTAGSLCRAAQIAGASLSRDSRDRLALVAEFARRYGEEELAPGEPFGRSYDVYAHFKRRLADAPVEHFIAIALDNKHRKIRDIVVSVGSLSASIVHPRDVFRALILEGAAAAILVHNHPSGDPTPSAEDLEITRRLKATAELVGIRLLDHIIIGRGRFVSFVDDGYMP